jgi:hypothetical protein
MKDAKGHGSDARGGSLPTVRLDNVGSRRPKTGYLSAPQPKYAVNQIAARAGEGGKLSTAVGERVAMRKAADEGRNPTSTITDRMAAMTLGQGHPKSNSVPLGYGAAAAKTDLWFGRNVAMARGSDNRRKS